MEAGVDQLVWQNTAHLDISRESRRYEKILFGELKESLYYQG